MSIAANSRVVVVRPPVGKPALSDFAVEPVPPPDGPGVLADVLYISVDPYLRGRLSGRHITAPLAAGEAMSSELVVRIAENAGGFRVGELVRAFGPWQRSLRLPVEQLVPIRAEIDPPSLSLGVLGMPGLTAYAGVTRLLRPQARQTILVSAASGPVGATVGQLCKATGARVVGVVGSPEKCRWLREEAGFDLAIDRRRQSIRAALATACPDGIDGYFDNVGGDVLQAAMERLAGNARVVLCGLMDQYNGDDAPPGPNPGLIIRARATVSGLVVYDHEDLRPRMETDLAERVAKGTLKFREHVFEGLDEAPAAFCALMAGGTFGKTVVKVRSQFP